MSIPTSSVSMTDLTHDTSLEATDQTVLFDSSEAKRATLGEVRAFVLNGVTYTYSNGRLTIAKVGDE